MLRRYILLLILLYLSIAGSLTLKAHAAQGDWRDGADEPPSRNDREWPEMAYVENNFENRTDILDLDDYFVSVDNLPLAYSAGNTDALVRAGFGIEIDQETHVLSFQFMRYYNTWDCLIEIEITCTDSVGAAVSDAMLASIDSVNYPPQARGTDIVFPPRTETNEAIRGEIAGSALITKFWDPDSNFFNHYAFDWVPAEIHLAAWDARPHMIHYDITANYNTARLENGHAIIKVLAIDTCGDSGFRLFDMTIHPDANDPISAGEAGSGFEYLTPADGYDIAYADSAVPILFSWRPAIQNQWETDSIAYHLSIRFDNFPDSLSWIVVDSTSIVIPLDTIQTLFPNHRPMPRPFSWKVYAIDRACEPLPSLSGSWFFDFLIPDVDRGHRLDSLLRDFSIEECYPNPFNSSTTITFSLPSSATGSLCIYGLDGRLVEKLWTGREAYPHGEHAVRWDASRVPAGEYFVRLEAGLQRTVRKVVLVK